jgi:long-chain acyl-CoA synthetase
MSARPELAAYGIPDDIDPDACGSVVELLEDAMLRYAERPAFRCFGHVLSYAEVDRLSRDFAAWLQNVLAIRKGERIAVMLPNFPAFPVAAIGILRAGAAQVNVNPLYTPRELEHQLNDAGVETIVIFAGSTGTLAEIVGRTRVKNVVTVAPATPPPRRWPPPPSIRAWRTRCPSPPPSPRAQGSASRPYPSKAATCCSCNTPAGPRDCRRARR